MRLKRLVSKDYLSKNKKLKFIHKKMHHKFLWNFECYGVAKGCAIGFFMCMMPIPFQMIPATILTFFFRANLIMAISFVWISNPITMVPMMYGAYLLGSKIMFLTPIDYQNNIYWYHFFLDINTIIIPLFIGSIIIGLLGGLIIFVSILIIYKISSINHNR